MADGNLKLGVDVEVGSDKGLQQLLKRVEDLERRLGGGVTVDLDTSEAESSLSRLSDLAQTAFTLDALGKAGDFLSGIAEGARATDQSFRDLAARTGASAAEMERLKDAAQSAFNAGVGENLGEAVDAIATAQNQLGDVFNADELAGFTTTAAGIAQVFDKDVNEVLTKSRTFIKNFGLDAEEAGDLLSIAMREGASGMDDVLDTLDEYSQLAKQAFGEGADGAAQFTSVLVNGVQAGLRDTDKLADAIKEAQIRLRAGDTSRTLADIASPITATIEGIVKAGEQGKISVAEVLKQTTEVTEDAFNSGQISESIRSQLQVAIAGTPAEDLGSDMYGRIFSAEIDTGAISARGAEARAALESAITPTNAFDAILRQAEGLGQSLAGMFAPAISGGASFLTTISQVAPALMLLQSGFGTVAKGALEFGKNILAKVVPGLFAQTTATVGLSAATGVQTAATVGATGALRAMFATMLTNPIFLITAGVVALGAALYALLSSGESVEEALEGVNAEIENTQNALTETAELDARADSLLQLADTYDRLENSTSAEGQAEFAAASRELASSVPEAVVAVDDLGEAANKTGDALKINTDVVRSFAESEKALNEEIRQGALAQLADETRDLADATADAKEEREDLLDKQKSLQDQLAKMEQQPGFDESSKWAQYFREELTEVTQELGAQGQAIKDGEEGIRSSVVELRKGGRSWEEIAKETGISADEAQNYAKQAELAARAAKQTERGAVDLRVQTESAAEKTKGLAEQWDKTSGAVRGSVDEMLKAIAFLILQSRQASTGWGLGEMWDAAARATQVAQLKENLRDQIKTMKELDGIINDLKVEFGLVEKTTTTTSKGISETLVTLTEVYRTATRETKKLKDEMKEADAELAGDAFAAVTAAYDAQATELKNKFKDANDDLAEQVAEARKKYDEAIKKGEKATLEFELELDDGTVLKGQKAIDAAKAALAEQEKVANEKQLRDREAAELEAAGDLFDKLLDLQRDYHDERREAEREALDFEIEFADEDSVAGLLALRDAREKILNQERDEKIRGIIEESDAFKAGQQEIKDAYAERLLEIQRMIRAGTVTEAEALKLREAAEKQSLEDLAALREDLTVTALADESSRAAKITEGYGKRVKVVYKEIGEKITELTKEFDKYEDALKRTTGILVDVWQQYYEDLDALRQADAEKAQETRSDDLASLKKDLLDMRITYEQYVSQLASLRDQDSGDEKQTQEEKAGFFEGFGKVLQDVSLQQTRSAADSLELAEDFSNAAEVMESSMSIAAAGIITAFTGLAAEGGAQIEEFGIAMLDVVAALLDSVVPALIALIWGESFAANPLTGGLLAAGITAVLLGLVSAAKSALASGLGSKMEGGYAGDGPRDKVMGVYHGGEFIHTKQTTQKYRDLFEFLHKGGTPEQWFIGKDGALTRSPGVVLLDRRQGAALLTNADGSTMNNREVISAVERQTAAVSRGLAELRSDVQTLNREFRHQVSTDVSVGGEIEGNVIRIAADKAAKRGRWS